VAQSKTPTQDELAHLNSLNGLLNANLAAARQSLDVAAANNPKGNLKPSLEARSQTASRAINQFLQAVIDLKGSDPAAIDALAAKALAASFGPATGPWLVQTARGLASAEVTDEPYQARGHGRETTYQENIDNWERVAAEISRLAQLVAIDVAAEQRPAGRVVVKVRYAPFLTYTRGQALAEPTMDPAAIEAGALAALGRFTSRRPVRLLGVRAEFAS